MEMVNDGMQSKISNEIVDSLFSESNGSFNRNRSLSVDTTRWSYSGNSRGEWQRTGGLESSETSTKPTSRWDILERLAVCVHGVFFVGLMTFGISQIDFNRIYTQVNSLNASLIQTLK